MSGRGLVPISPVPGANNRPNRRGRGLPVPIDDEAVDAVLEGARPVVEAIVRRGDSPETYRAYARDLATYALWLNGEDLDWIGVTPDDLDRYREWLAGQYAPTTVNRRLMIVRLLYAEAYLRELIARNPASRLRLMRWRDDRDGGALTKGQAQDVFLALERDLSRPPRRLTALRDTAIVAILVRTGIRRAELAALTVESLGSAQGHRTLSILAKGNVRRTVKVPPDVVRMIEAWLDAARSSGVLLGPADPLFVAVRKGGRIDDAAALSDRAIYDVVARRLAAAGLERLGPHGLRATFVTLALEGGAALHLVQRAVGHADPRTTERYWRRKESLDDNAVDYVRL